MGEMEIMATESFRDLAKIDVAIIGKHGDPTIKTLEPAEARKLAADLLALAQVIDPR